MQDALTPDGAAQHRHHQDHRLAAAHWAPIQRPYPVHSLAHKKLVLLEAWFLHVLAALVYFEI